MRFRRNEFPNIVLEIYFPLPVRRYWNLFLGGFDSCTEDKIVPCNVSWRFLSISGVGIVCMKMSVCCRADCSMWNSAFKISGFSSICSWALSCSLFSCVSFVAAVSSDVDSHESRNKVTRQVHILSENVNSSFNFLLRRADTASVVETDVDDVTG